MEVQIDGNLLIRLTDTDLAALRNDLLDEKEWFKGAIVGKINNCKKRLIAEWQPRLFADPMVESIPANVDQFVEMVIARDDYKDRVDREEG